MKLVTLRMLSVNTNLSAECFNSSFPAPTSTNIGNIHVESQDFSLLDDCIVTVEIKMSYLLALPIGVQQSTWSSFIYKDFPRYTQARHVHQRHTAVNFCFILSSDSA